MSNRNYSRKLTVAANKNIREREYWLNRLAGPIVKSRFPGDYEDADGRRGGRRMAECPFKFPSGLLARLEALSKGSDYKLHMILLAGVIALLRKYTDHSDVIVGVPIYKQAFEGEFVNTVLALRHTLEGGTRFKELLQQVRKTVFDANEHQNYPIETLLYQLNLSASEDDFPLFDVVVLLENIHDKKYIRHIHPNMVFSFKREAGHLEGLLAYNASLYREATAAGILSRLKILLGEALSRLDRELSGLSLLSETEKERLLLAFNDTGAQFSRHKTIHRLFEEQVERTPHRTAVVMDDESVTYHRLNGAADRLARYLLLQGRAQSDDRVGILLDRSIAQVTTILGILKAGGAYVPLDCSFPERRVQNMIVDGEIGVVISQKKYLRILNRLQWECLSLHTYCCLDSGDIHSEVEVEKSELMEEKLWNYVGETAVDDITGGGWLSSYTGDPISREEMDEYGDNVLQKLAPLLHKDMRVLEIGCASGITMYRIAPRVGQYYGTDLSRVTIEKNRERVKQEGHTNIRLDCLAAHEIDQLGEGGFHLVIINSVIQCFHGHNYFRKVITKVIDAMAEEGCLFIGDVMDQELKGSLVQDMKDFERRSKKEGKGSRSFRTKTDFSEELFVSRGFFRDLGSDRPEIAEITFSDKIHTIENELTKFRYDVLLKVDKNRRAEEPISPKRKRQHDFSHLQALPPGEVDARVGPDSIAYLIYTSGSTGDPKAVVIEHRSVVNMLEWRKEEYRLGLKSVALQLFSYAFDGFVTSFFTPVISGARIVLLDEGDCKDITGIKRAILRNGVSHFICVPALFQVMLENLEEGEAPGLEAVTLAGDKLPPGLVQETLVKLENLEIVNEYGITESSVASTIFRHQEREEIVRIGKPIWNTRIYIFDRCGQLQPPGIAGELCIAGAGLTRGYLNNPRLTAEKIVENPLVKGERLYRTGDLARWLPEGDIQFLGRIDHQVKIRGVRIELGEIENRLRKHESVREVIVLAEPGKGESGDGERDKLLCAYVVAEKGFKVAELREYLAAELPDYMIPSYFMAIDRVPLTVTGKVDRRALPVPGIEMGEEHVAPRSETEKKLAAIWSELLGIEREVIGIDVNFFEIGGHSLRATILVARLHKELNVKVSIAEVFKRQTIRGLGQFIEAAAREKFRAIEPAEKKDYYPLSSAQRRLYFLQQLNPQGTVYNLPQVVLLDAEFDGERLASIFEKLIERHESLRTSFAMPADQPVQRVFDRVDFAIRYYEPQGGDGPGLAGMPGEILAGFVQPFDLSEAPLVRVTLVRTTEARHILMVDMHHIVTDGISNGILVQDFLSLSRGEELPRLRVQYKDFSEWQREMYGSGSEALKKEEEYWLRHFEGEIPLLDLPADFPRPPVKNHEGSVLAFKIDRELTGEIKELVTGTEVTQYILLLAAFNILLAKYAKQEEVVVGSPVTGRTHADLQDVIGMFVNMLAMRNRPGADKTFREFLEEVKENALGAYENQHYPFEELVGKLGIERDLGRHPLFDASIELQNFDVGQGEPENGDRRQGNEQEGNDAVETSPAGHSRISTQFDLVLGGKEIDGILQMHLEYSTELFAASSMKRMAGRYVEILKQVVKDPHTRIKDISIYHDLLAVKSPMVEEDQAGFEF